MSPLEAVAEAECRWYDPALSTFHPEQRPGTGAVGNRAGPQPATSACRIRGAGHVVRHFFLWQEGGWWRVAFVAVFILLGLYFHDLYENYRVPSRTLLLQQFCFVVGIAFLLQALLSYGRWDIILPRRIMLYGSLLVLVFGPLWRIVFTRAVWQAVGAQKLLFLGASPGVREIIQSLRERPELGMVPIGFVGLGRRLGKTLDSVPRLGSASDLSATVGKLQPDRSCSRHARAVRCASDSAVV